MAEYAFVRNGVVFRVAEWDAVGNVPSDIVAVLTNGNHVQAGDYYDGSVFSPTPPSPQATLNYTTLIARGQTALQANKTFLALASPTNPQSLAQIQSLTRQMDGLIRLISGKLDSTEDT